MNSPPRRGHAPILLPLLWLGFLCGTVVAALGEVLPWRLSFVRPGNLFVVLAEVQVFFVLFLWPLFVPSLAGKGEAGRMFLHAGVLVLLGIPPALVGAGISAVGPAAFLRVQFLVAASAALAGAVLLVGVRRGCPVGPWYLLGAFAAAGLAPYAAFLHYEFGPREELPWIVVLSPFWGASRPEGSGPLLQGIAAAALAAAILALGRSRRGEVSP